MKKGFLASTALVGATSLFGAAAIAAEAPTWKLSGNVNFQFYWVDQDASGLGVPIYTTGPTGATALIDRTSGPNFWAVVATNVFDTGATGVQEHDWYFGVDESELQLNVSGTADNGLNYGFKIEINANTTDGTVADEVRLQLAGGWGTLQMGDEDGAEDIMNYGGENLMGATGGFDGDQDDYLFRGGNILWASWLLSGTSQLMRIDALEYLFPGPDAYDTIMNVAAPGYPTIAGDTSDQTKISYFSPRFSGFQVGASLTPTPNNGDNFKADGNWENHVGVGANYDNSFGDLRVRASAVYSHATNSAKFGGYDRFADVSAWSVGGIVGWGPFSLGANYTDNGDSGQPLIFDVVAATYRTAPIETSYWDVAASYETGPMSFSVGYFASTLQLDNFDDSTYEHLSLTADYTVAAGLGVYAEVNMMSDELLGNSLLSYDDGGPPPHQPLSNQGLTLSNDTTSLIVGMNVSF